MRSDASAVVPEAAELSLQHAVCYHPESTDYTPCNNSSTDQAFACVCRRLPRNEFLIARLTRNSRSPMADSIHVLVCRVLRGELTGACSAFEYRCPVVQLVHVLIASALGTEEYRSHTRPSGHSHSCARHSLPTSRIRRNRSRIHTWWADFEG